MVNGLNARKGTWPSIAADTGVPRSTIAKIAGGQTPNPGVQTVEQLAEHLRLLERQEAERRAPGTEPPPEKRSGPVEREGDRPSQDCAGGSSVPSGADLLSNAA